VLVNLGHNEEATPFEGIGDNLMEFVLALRVTLILWEDKPSTHHSFWWMLVLCEWRSMDKTQYMNDVQHRTGQEMHREERATLNSISELSLSVRRGKT
jgi:hypothetical protein